MPTHVSLQAIQSVDWARDAPEQAQVVLGGLLYVLAPGGPSDVAATVLLLMLVAGAVVGLLMVVMRALLRQATALRTEMEAVV